MRKKPTSARANWARRLPHTIFIPEVMAVSTLADARTLVERHLPADHRAKDLGGACVDTADRRRPGRNLNQTWRLRYEWCWRWKALNAGRSRKPPASRRPGRFSLPVPFAPGPLGRYRCQKCTGEGARGQPRGRAVLILLGSLMVRPGADGSDVKADDDDREKVAVGHELLYLVVGRCTCARCYCAFHWIHDRRASRHRQRLRFRADKRSCAASIQEPRRGGPVRAASG